MKTNLKFLAIVASFGLFFQSCSNDDDHSTESSAPEITSFEYGEGSTHETGQVAYKGSDIHLEAEITAESTVSSITISIHAHDLELAEGEEEWEFEEVFTDASYLVINPTFHEHVDVPTNIPSGEYHIELLVTDELGNSTEVEGYIQILDVITLSDFSVDSSVARGDDFHAEFMIHAVHGIHNITVDIHAHDLPVADGEVAWDYEAEFLEGYHEETEVEFHQHIDVPATAPVGEYHVIFTVQDEDGNTKEYETHIDITE
ncbi:DUF4625 domain-containing protein [Lacinutrix sp. C3R15]|uniref:DUF4625 domain-containing protein n=1 Tax=Flavobacteriaceae TaxID=49546 RepID=UPI001C09CC19|nr:MULTISPECIES: DUF4625 domain-containing protein [Flavobacteriaceae]MBU2938495.1 DUF4625 domain-containing protein [Lacinutrix sp. C3R15]MDO6621809.1 DUF4625 domain-containing protein [Oceanihabitans sp. 1_MG-2023]